MVELLTVPKNSYLEFDGRERDLPTKTERLQLVNLWASWCRPCLAESDRNSCVPQHTIEGRTRQTARESMTYDECGLPLHFIHGNATPEYVSCLFECLGGHETITRVLPHKDGVDFWREVG